MYIGRSDRVSPETAESRRMPDCNWTKVHVESRDCLIKSKLFFSRAAEFGLREAQGAALIRNINTTSLSRQFSGKPGGYCIY